MKFEKNTVAEVKISVFSATGTLLDQDNEVVPVLFGGDNGLPPKVDQSLANLEIGAKIEIDLNVDEAFGEVIDELQFWEEGKNLPGQIELGAYLEGESDEGEVILFRIVQIKDGQVLLDGNHPLAGQDLKFHVSIENIRAATEEEVTQGFVGHSCEHDCDCGHEH